MPDLSDLSPVDDHLMPSGEGRPGDLRRTVAGRLGNGQGLRDSQVAADLVAQIARLPGDVEVLKHGPLPGDQISHSAHLTTMHAQAARQLAGLFSFTTGIDSLPDRTAAGLKNAEL